MITITPEELSKFRGALQDNDEALEALDVVEECNGNLEEAMEIVMINAGMEPVRGDDDWIDFENIGKELRKVICTQAFEYAFVNGSFAIILGHLINENMYPTAMLVLFIFYWFRLGFDHFCNPEESV